MKLLVKFNLAFVAVFSLGLAATTFLAQEVLQGIAKEEVADRARLLMEKASVQLNRALQSMGVPVF